MNTGNFLGGLLGTFLILETLNLGVGTIKKGLDTPLGGLD